MISDTKKEFLVLHLNKRNNGGNAALSNFSSNFAKYSKTAISEAYIFEKLSDIWKVFNKQYVIIYSNPIIGVFLFWKRSSIQFIQSIDEDLFSEDDFPYFAVKVYRFLVATSQKFNNSIKVFNSKFTLYHYRRLKKVVGVYDVVNNLLPRMNFHSAKLNPSAVWIGTNHRRKGFNELVKFAQLNPKIEFNAIFSGQSNSIKQNQKSNIKIFANLQREEVYDILKDSNFLIVTSSFESLCLPIYEGIMFENFVIAKESKYIFANGMEDHVNIFKKPFKISPKNLKKSTFKFKDPTNVNLKLFSALKNEL